MNTFQILGQALIGFLAALFVAAVLFCGGALLISLGRKAWKDVRSEYKKARRESAQREADEHTFDLISKGHGGAI